MDPICGSFVRVLNCDEVTTTSSGIICLVLVVLPEFEPLVNFGTAPFRLFPEEFRRLNMVKLELAPPPPTVELAKTAAAALVVVVIALVLVSRFSLGGGFGNRLRSHACRRAWLGVILVHGSQSRHLRMKSKNSGSSQPFRADTISLLPGEPRGLPRRDRPPFITFEPSGNVVTVQYRGYPFELIKFRARFDWSSSFCGGIPSNSIIQAS